MEQGFMVREKGHSHKTHPSASSHKGKGKAEKEHVKGKRSWRGRRGERGPWRTDEDVSGR